MFQLTLKWSSAGRWWGAGNRKLSGCRSGLHWQSTYPLLRSWETATGATVLFFKSGTPSLIPILQRWHEPRINYFKACKWIRGGKSSGVQRKGNLWQSLSMSREPTADKASWILMTLSGRKVLGLCDREKSQAKTELYFCVNNNILSHWN